MDSLDETNMPHLQLLTLVLMTSKGVVMAPAAEAATIAVPAFVAKICPKDPGASVTQNRKLGQSLE